MARARRQSVPPTRKDKAETNGEVGEEQVATLADLFEQRQEVELAPEVRQYIAQLLQTKNDAVNEVGALTLEKRQLENQVNGAVNEVGRLMKLLQSHGIDPASEPKPPPRAVRRQAKKK